MAVLNGFLYVILALILGTAWHWTWVDAVALMAGVAWSLMPERDGDPEPTQSPVIDS